MTGELQGIVQAGFEQIEAVFSDGFNQGREVGAALTVLREGEVLIDLVGGHTNRARSALWQPDTLVCCFSISKAISSMCVLRAVDAGHLALDALVTRYWPEFGQVGKGEVTVRDLLSHQAGVPGFHEPVDREFYYRWDEVCRRLAEESPWWPPGTAHGYHARTLGFLLGELLHRASGRTIDKWLRDMAEQVSADLHFGLSTPDQARCADMLPAKVRPGDTQNWSQAMRRMAADFGDPSTVTGATFQNPAMRAGYMNTPEFRSALIPAINGHGTSRGIATLFAALPQLLHAETLVEAGQTQVHGPDEVLKSKTRFGLGFMLYEEESPIGWPGCMGHAGAGGSVAFYDPKTKVAFAFVMNQMQEGVVTGGTTAQTCIDALKAALT